MALDYLKSQNFLDESLPEFFFVPVIWSNLNVVDI